jgi:hypothetical protein
MNSCRSPGGKIQHYFAQAIQHQHIPFFGSSEHISLRADADMINVPENGLQALATQAKGKENKAKAVFHS